MDDLDELRQKIDEIDDQLLQLISKRLQVCKLVGTEKKKSGLPIRDLAREDEVYRRIKKKSARLGLDSKQVEAVYREIVNMCSAVQE